MLVRKKPSEKQTQDDQAASQTTRKIRFAEEEITQPQMSKSPSSKSLLKSPSQSLLKKSASTQSLNTNKLSKEARSAGVNSQLTVHRPEEEKDHLSEIVEEKDNDQESQAEFDDLVDKIEGLDQNLVKMLMRIEIKCKDMIEDYE